MADQVLIAPHQALSDDRAIRRQGLVLLLVVFGGFGTWASLAPLNSAALAPGVITVEHYRKTVQHLEGGIIRTLDVHDGDSVQQDQVIATLDDTQSRAQLEVLRGNFTSESRRKPGWPHSVIDSLLSTIPRNCLRTTPIHASRKRYACRIRRSRFAGRHTKVRAQCTADRSSNLSEGDGAPGSEA